MPAAPRSPSPTPRASACSSGTARAARSRTASPSRAPRDWTWNGSEESPTLAPSVLIRWPHGNPPTERRCHSFVREGRVMLLTDCTHALAGKTVDIPPWDSDPAG